MTYRYLTVKVNGKTKLKHRHIMEQHLDRALLPGEQKGGKQNLWRAA